MTTEWISVGSDVWYRTHTCQHMTPKPAGALIRFGGGPEAESYDHDAACVGGISWCPECRGPTWELHSLDPLHVEPSIQTRCKKHPEHHGHIRNGIWAPA